MKVSPTRQNYGTLEDAYVYFNKVLFGGELPNCLITVQRQKGALGYFSRERFARIGSGETTDEIAMNPNHFHTRSMPQVLSTLVHEMVHLWQFRFGAKPPQAGYHNKEWAAKMRSIGLIPSNTGAPGGKETGQNMTHYIEEGGRFEKACVQWLEKNGGGILYHDRVGDEQAAKLRKKKAASKTKYTCPDCDTAAWGKPNLFLICGDCETRMEQERPSLN